MLLPFATT